MNYAITKTPTGILHLKECKAIPDGAVCWCSEGDRGWTREAPDAPSEASSPKVKSYRGKKKTPQAKPQSVRGQTKVNRTPTDAQEQREPLSVPLGVTLPLVSGKLWEVPQGDFDRWQKAFEWDILPELKKMELWLRENKARRPRSVQGTKAFVTRWLNRADDSRHRPSGGQHSGGDDPQVQFNLLWARLLKKWPDARDWESERIRTAFEKAGVWRPEFSDFLEG